MTQAPNPPVALFGTRSKDLDPTQYSYKYSNGSYGLDIAIDDFGIDEKRMALRFPFADGRRRDGVGDLLEVGGIRTDRHKQNPICLFDHGKSVTLPIGIAEDPATKLYTVEIDPIGKTAWVTCFFYQGKGLPGTKPDEEYQHATFCEQLFDLAAQRYIRAGSIGYQVVKAMKLPADYEQGTPPGLHLLVTLMLEGSLVVLPANGDTVRKALALPQVCGKPLSPYLVKSLSPYAEEKKVMVNGIGEKSLDEATNPKALGETEQKGIDVIQHEGGWWATGGYGKYRAGPFTTPAIAWNWVARYGEPNAENQGNKGLENPNLPQFRAFADQWDASNPQDRTAILQAAGEDASLASRRFGELPHLVRAALLRGNMVGTKAQIGEKAVAKRGRTKVDGLWYDYDGREQYGKIEFTYDYGTTWKATKKEAWETAKSNGTLKPSMRQDKSQPSNDIDPAKARQILKDGEANGKPLTEAQRGMFGAAANKGIKALRRKYHKAYQSTETLQRDHGYANNGFSVRNENPGTGKYKWGEEADYWYVRDDVARETVAGPFRTESEARQEMREWARTAHQKAMRKSLGKHKAQEEILIVNATEADMAEPSSTSKGRPVTIADGYTLAALGHSDGPPINNLITFRGRKYEISPRSTGTGSAWRRLVAKSLNRSTKAMRGEPIQFGHYDEDYEAGIYAGEAKARELKQRGQTITANTSVAHLAAGGDAYQSGFRFGWNTVAQGKGLGAIRRKYLRKGREYLSSGQTIQKGDGIKVVNGPFRGNEGTVLQALNDVCEVQWTKGTGASGGQTSYIRNEMIEKKSMQATKSYHAAPQPDSSAKLTDPNGKVVYVTERDLGNLAQQLPRMLTQGWKLEEIKSMQPSARTKAAPGIKYNLYSETGKLLKTGYFSSQREAEAHAATLTGSGYYVTRADQEGTQRGAYFDGKSIKSLRTKYAKKLIMGQKTKYVKGWEGYDIDTVELPGEFRESLLRIGMFTDHGITYSVDDNGKIVIDPRFKGKPIISKSLKSLRNKYGKRLNQKSVAVSIQGRPGAIVGTTVEILEGIHSGRRGRVRSLSGEELLVDLGDGGMAAVDLSQVRPVGYRYKDQKSLKVQYRSKLIKGYTDLDVAFDVSHLDSAKQMEFYKAMDEAGFGKPTGGKWGEDAKTLLSPLKKARFKVMLDPDQDGVKALAAAATLASNHGAKLLGQVKSLNGTAQVNSPKIDQSVKGKSNMRVRTKADPGMEVPTEVPANVEGQVEQAAGEPLSAQVLRRIHEHHLILMEEYDQMVNVVEHPEIKEFLQTTLEGIEQMLEAVEGLMQDHHPELEQLEGIKDLDDNGEAMSPDEENEIPAEEAAVAMQEKRWGAKIHRKYIKAVCPGCNQEPCECGGEGLKEKKRLIKSIGKCLGKALTEDEVGEVVDKLEGEMEDTEQKGIKGGSDKLRGRNQAGQIRAIWHEDPDGDYHPDAKMIQAVGRLLGKDLTNEEAGAVMDKMEGEMEEDYEIETKSILCKAHKDALTGAAGFLDEASQHSGTWEDEHRTKAAAWHKAISEIGAEAPPEEFEEVSGAEPGEMGQKGSPASELVVKEGKAGRKNGDGDPLEDELEGEMKGLDNVTDKNGQPLKAGDSVVFRGQTMPVKRIESGQVVLSGPNGVVVASPMEVEKKSLGKVDEKSLQKLKSDLLWQDKALEEAMAMANRLAKAAN